MRRVFVFLSSIVSSLHVHHALATAAVEGFGSPEELQRPYCRWDHNFDRVVGYYGPRGFLRGHECMRLAPQSLPSGVYTHVNFAYAIIDPVTFRIRPATSDLQNVTESLFTMRVNPGIKLWISIGDSLLNDPQQNTATAFSHLAASEAKQTKFISSLISFLSTYGFDGVDLNWQFPGAPDRHGRPEDFANYPKFLANLRQGLRSTGGRNGLSITLPALPQYLQHFDLKQLEPQVDFFNFMSFDLHGKWDNPTKSNPPLLFAHNNLSEIDSALDLLWENAIPPEKVSMALSFSGRGFTATDPACLAPGCPYSSASVAGKCSPEAGTLTYAEIEEILNTPERNATVTHERKEGVAVLTYDTDQWVAYEDMRTISMKVRFARERCLGGVTVWGVNHDAPNRLGVARLSGTLGAAATLRRVERFVDVPGMTQGEELLPCIWAGCGGYCGQGYNTVPRWDAASQGEMVMHGDQGCEGSGSKPLCCPVRHKQPRCGWYGDGECPSGWLEVDDHEHGKGRAAVACCEETPGVNTEFPADMELPPEVEMMFAEALEEFLKDPTCKSEVGSMKLPF